MWAGNWEAQDYGRGLLFPAWCPEQVIEKERPQLTECEEPSIYSPAFPREKWQRKRTQVKIRVCVWLPGASLSMSPASSGSCLISALPWLCPWKPQVPLPTSPEPWLLVSLDPHSPSPDVLRILSSSDCSKASWLHTSCGSTDVHMLSLRGLPRQPYLLHAPPSEWS